MILNIEDAFSYFNKSYEYAHQINDNRQMALALTNLAAVQLERNDYAKAIENANKSIKYLTALNDYNGLGETYNILGMVYKEQKNYMQSS